MHRWVRGWLSERVDIEINEWTNQWMVRIRIKGLVDRSAALTNG